MDTGVFRKAAQGLNKKIDKLGKEDVNQITARAVIRQLHIARVSLNSFQTLYNVGRTV